jgi:SAM-dependent methyltransferase
MSFTSKYSNKLNTQNLNTYDTSVKSCNQFNIIFKNNNNNMLYYSFLQIFNKPFNMKNYEQRQINYSIFNNVKKMALNNISDNDIYLYIHNKLNELYYPIYGFPNNNSEERSDSRVGDINYFINNSGVNNKIISYLDFGCSEGGITEKVGKSLDLNKNNIIGIDILSDDLIHKKNEFTYFQINNNDSFPIDTDSIDLITALMVFHHLPEPLFYIKEIYRTLKKNALLIIREHDIDSETNKEGQIYIDILHGMYNMSWSKLGEQENPNHCTNYFAKYNSRNYWNNILTSIGFERVDYRDIDKYYNMNEIDRIYTPKKWIKNLINSYWGVYIKK